MMKRIFPLFLRLALWGVCVAAGLQMVRAEGLEGRGSGLKMHELLERVLRHNESIQVQALELQIREKGYKAEWGIFEPQVTGSYEHVNLERENTVQQQLSLLGVPVLRERNNIYNGGLEVLSPIGTQFRLGLNVRDLRNNLGGRLGATESRVEQFESFAGASFVQPLLKNFGTTATLARIRLAALASELAFQEYRRQTMLVISQAEAAYWDLYLTQEQERISQESVSLAETILADNRERVEVGKSSELEVLEARSGLALRKALQNEARLRRLEGANQVTRLFSDAALDTNLVVQAVDEPMVKDISFELQEHFQRAFHYNPDYLSGLKRVGQEEIRVAFAQNQRWPQLDLKASYGLNGLGETVGESLEDISNADFPSWTVGVEMRIPVLGGVRERNELEAAKLSKKQALVNLKGIEVQIANGVDTALHRVRSYRDNIERNEEVVEFYEQLLETQLARLDVGKTDSRTVLETEEKLFQARIALLENLVQYQKAILELQLVSGTVLQDRELEISKDELSVRTTALLKRASWSDRELEKIKHDLVKDFEERIINPGAAARQHAIQALRHGMEVEELPSYRETEAHQKALELLRERQKELRN